MARNRSNKFPAKPWVDIALFEEQSDGEALEAFLKTKGIEARTYHDAALQYVLFLRPPRVIFQVQLRHNISKSAIEQMLNEPVAVAILEAAVHCPDCGSLHVDYPNLTRNSFFPTARLLLGIIFHLREHECHCQNCHRTWNLPHKAHPTLPEPAIREHEPG